MKLLNYGFFEDFKGSDTLLFDGTADELLLLANVLHKVASGALVGEINLDQSMGFQPRRSTVANIRVSSEARNEVVIERSGESVVANWWLTPAGAAEAAELVENVANSERPGHEFLPDGGDIQVIVAKDEYPGLLR